MAETINHSFPTAEFVMKRLSRRCFLLLSLALSVLSISSGTRADAADKAKDAAEASNGPPPGFVSLLNGNDLSGWRGMGHFDPQTLWAMSPDEQAAFWEKNSKDLAEHWTIENGDLVNDGHGVYATTAKDYGDFELMIDYKTVPLADSGIYLRATPQVQIWDTRKEGGKWKLGADKGSGALWNNKIYDRFPYALADKPFGEWNRFHIRMVDDSVTIRLNDQLTAYEVPLENFFDRKRTVFPVGPIQLQTHGGEIRWRNIFIKEIPRRPPESGVTDRNGQPVGDGWQTVKAASTKQTTVSDFDLHATISLAGSGSKAGLLFRGPNSDSDVSSYRLELTAEPAIRLINVGGDGTLVEVTGDSVKKSLKTDAPNHIYTRVRGDHFETWLNGNKVVDTIHTRGPKQGLLATFAAGQSSSIAATTIENVFLRSLDTKPTPHDATAETGFVSLFNGKNLDGWVGAIKGHIVEHGVIVSPKGGGGNLYYDKEFSDFVLRFDFTLETNGNNGVGIRSEIGKNAAYHGMEIQILDNTGSSYRKLKQYQYHGSIYGVVPAKRGYQRPLGYWNTQEIYAKGNHIRVTVNGQVIVDADLEEAAKGGTIDGGKHPGLFNKSGYIGFLGHGHQIKFRNIRIKELK
jgi:hypothetical protein